MSEGSWKACQTCGAALRADDSEYHANCIRKYLTSAIILFNNYFIILFIEIFKKENYRTSLVVFHSGSCRGKFCVW